MSDGKKREKTLLHGCKNNKSWTVVDVDLQNGGVSLVVRSARPTEKREKKGSGGTRTLGGGGHRDGEGVKEARNLGSQQNRTQMGQDQLCGKREKGEWSF